MSEVPPLKGQNNEAFTAGWVVRERPSYTPTIVVSMFLGVFGLLPALRHSRMARERGYSTSGYWWSFWLPLLVPTGLVALLITSLVIASHGINGSATFSTPTIAPANTGGNSGSSQGIASGTTQSVPATAYDSISCPSASFCMAVSASGMAFTDSNGSWSNGQSFDTKGTGSAYVSCASSSFCMAVRMGNVFNYSNGSWSNGKLIDSQDNLAGALTSISCPSSSFCETADVSGFAITFSNGKWGRAYSLNGTSNPPGYDTISCSSPSFCMTTDGVSNVFTYTKGRWSNAHQVGPSKNLNYNFNMLSCPSQSFCAMSSSSGGGPDFWTYSNGHWSSDPRAPQPELSSVSCPTTSFCLATGASSASGTGQQSGFVWTLSNGKWSNGLKVDPHGDLVSASCASPSFCAAVDYAGFRFVYSNGTWTTG